jgi:hypothetical protein
VSEVPVHADAVITPVPEHDRQVTQAPVVDERIEPDAHVGMEEEEEEEEFEEEEEDDGGLTVPAVEQPEEHVPLQAFEVRPAVLPYVPTGQAVHNVAPDVSE